MSPPNFRSGFVSIIGEPNVGKSTLLNTLLGQNISITADKPQTTRGQIRGIISTEEYQAVVIDTPGIHKPKNELHRRSVNWAKNSLNDADIIFWLVQPHRGREGGLSPNDLLVLKVLDKVASKVVLLINKLDLFSKELINETILSCQKIFPFEEIIPISARKGKGLQHVNHFLATNLPLGVAYYHPDQLTDLSEKSLAAELLREQIMRRCFQEVPYGVAVVVESFLRREGKLKIYATIFVERESHKGIMIGKQGVMLRQIKTAAGKKMEKLFSDQVELKVHFKVSANWFNNPEKLNEFGYSLNPVE